MIIPSIDLMDRKAVQLVQGREKKLEVENVLELAKEFSKYGEIAVIDLDAALSNLDNQGNKTDNLELIKQICKIADCRVGGGIRTLEKARELLRAGAKKIIIGTKADIKFLKQLPRDRVIVAIDTKDGFVVNKGWKNKTKKTPLQVIKELEKYCSEFLFTNVNREGLMQGVDIDIIIKITNATKSKITVAGGITTLEEIEKIESLNTNSQLGMALYTGKIKLDEAFISLLDFEKNKIIADKNNKINVGLIPTIIQDENDQVLMLAYSSKESLLNTFKTNKAIYYSRRRKKLWQKGETSGNYQELITARYDCDRDTLLFTVKQKNVACHTNTYSCFGDKEFAFEDLYGIIQDRIKNPKKGSYTSKIARDETQIKKKIREEALEVVNYKDRANLVWEIADLSYFVLMLMAKNNISIDEIKNELFARRK